MAVLTVRSEFLPKWTAYLALLVGLAAAVATVGVGSAATWTMVFQLVGYLGWMLWVLIASYLLYMRKAD